MSKLLSVRFDESLLLKVDEYAKTVGIRRSQAIEVLAWLALGRPTRFWGGAAPRYGLYRSVHEDDLVEALPVDGEILARRASAKTPKSPRSGAD